MLCLENVYIAVFKKHFPEQEMELVILALDHRVIGVVEVAVGNIFSQMREQYAEGNSSQKSQLTPGILDLEQRVRQLQEEVRSAANWVRREEQSILK